MHVTEIELLQTGWNEVQARWTGVVAFRDAADPQRILIQADTPLPRQSSAPAVRAALVGEAARQLRRMPEFRRHPERLVLAPEPLAMAAG